MNAHYFNLETLRLVRSPHDRVDVGSILATTTFCANCWSNCCFLLVTPGLVKIKQSNNNHSKKISLNCSMSKAPYFHSGMVFSKTYFEGTFTWSRKNQIPGQSPLISRTFFRWCERSSSASVTLILFFLFFNTNGAWAARLRAPSFLPALWRHHLWSINLTFELRFEIPIDLFLNSIFQFSLTSFKSFASKLNFFAKSRKAFICHSRHQPPLTFAFWAQDRSRKNFQMENIGTSFLFLR